MLPFIGKINQSSRVFIPADLTILESNSCPIEIYFRLQLLLIPHDKQMNFFHFNKRHCYKFQDFYSVAVVSSLLFSVTSDSIDKK